MGTTISLLILVFVMICSRCAYRFGYEKGNNDGYNQGWADKIQVCNQVEENEV